MSEIVHRRDLPASALIFFSCTILFFGLVCTVVFADDQSHYSLEKAIDIIDSLKQKLSEGEKLSEEEREALEILERSQRKSKPRERRSSTAYQRRDYSETGRYKTIKGTQPALGVVLEHNILCEQKLFNNNDGLTFTYLRRTKEGYTEKWVFLKNANPFYWANYWDDVDKRFNKLERVDSKIKYQLPPSKVLIEIVTLAKICPFEVSVITGTDTKIFNTATVIPYWANEEYFYTESGSTQQAATVSLYYAKKGHQNKNRFAIIWPCYLKSREKS
ncbi:hypothetical protein ACFL0H_09060 [Thermodesulfobacteriota bacterium]